MKQTISIMLCLITLLAATAQTKHFDIKVGDFENLLVTDNINVVYESNTKRAGTAVFDCPQNIADGLIFTNNMHGRLTIQVSTEVLGTPNLPTLHVYSKELKFAENGGDSTLTLIKPLSHKTLKLLLSDNGTIHLKHAEVSELELKLITGKGLITASGFSHKLKADLLGKGTIDASEVSAQNIRCHIIGTGTINVAAEGADLAVRGSGTGQVNYLGTPSNLKIRKLGPVKVNKMDP